MQAPKIIIACALLQSAAWASVDWHLRIPNGEYARIGQKTRCQICHEYSAPDQSTANFLNGFGADFRTAGNQWGQSLATRDSDGDQFTNEVELNCKNNYTWSTGPCGSDLSNVYNPGDPEITPGIAVEKPAPAAGPALSAHPNPFTGAVTLIFPAGAGRILSILDARGSTVFSVGIPAGADRFLWTGTHDRGAPLPTGVYLCAVSGAGGTFKARLILTR